MPRQRIRNEVVTSSLAFPGGVCSKCGDECDRRSTVCKVCSLRKQLRDAIDERTRRRKMVAYANKLREQYKRKPS